MEPDWRMVTDVRGGRRALLGKGSEAARALEVERAEVLTAAEALATARTDGFLLDD